MQKKIKNKRKIYKKSNYFKKNNNKPVRKKRKYKTRKKSFYGIQLFLFSIIIILLSLIIYTFFLFPKQLNKKIKNELIEIYNPVIYDDPKNIFILKLKERPSYDLQLNTYNSIKQKFGLDTNFEKINSNINSGINKISFSKNNKKFNEIQPIYIFWDFNIEKEKIVKIENKKESLKLNYEVIENKRKNEKQEKLINPDINKFQYGTYKETKTIEIKPKIAIVIDDVGYSYNSTYDFLSLGFPVTFALIPEMRDSEKFYNLFRKYDYDMLLHIPMEPIKGKKYVEKNAIFTDMSDEIIRNKIIDYLNKYPDVIGANNHMGSKAIADARVMDIILNELAVKDKIWLDSMTNLNTVSKEIASIHNLHYYERDVFLDNSKNINEIRKAMNQLIKEAKQKGQAVGIGHIQSRELAQVLKEYYLKREQLGIEFVPLKKL